MQTSNVDTNIVVTGRHVEVTDAIREFATKKIQGIHIDYPRIVEARVVVDVQKDRQVAEIVLFCADHITIQASTVGSDLYAAIDETVTKIMRRMRKHKTRLMKRFRPHRSESIRKLDEKVYEEDVLDYEDYDAPEDPKPVRISREGYVLTVANTGSTFSAGWVSASVGSGCSWITGSVWGVGSVSGWVGAVGRTTRPVVKNSITDAAFGPVSSVASFPGKPPPTMRSSTAKAMATAPTRRVFPSQSIPFLHAGSPAFH